jgi:hypothetical protein
VSPRAMTSHSVTATTRHTGITIAATYRSVSAAQNGNILLPYPLHDLHSTDRAPKSPLPARSSHLGSWSRSSSPRLGLLLVLRASFRSSPCRIAYHFSSLGRCFLSTMALHEWVGSDSLPLLLHRLAREQISHLGGKSGLNLGACES